MGGFFSVVGKLEGGPDSIGGRPPIPVVWEGWSAEVQDGKGWGLTLPASAWSVRTKRCQLRALPSAHSHTLQRICIFSIRRDKKFQTLDSLFQFQSVKLLMLQSSLESVWRKQQTYEKEKLYVAQMSSLNLQRVFFSKAMLGQASFHIPKG